MAKLLRCVLPFCLQSGILDKYGVELIGAKLPSINKAEDRELFKQAMVKIGLKTPPSGTISNWSEALEVLDMIGKFPLIIRPAFTLGGTGGGIAYNMDEYQEIINAGLNASVTNQVCQAVHNYHLTILLSCCWTQECCAWLAAQLLKCTQCAIHTFSHTSSIAKTRLLMFLALVKLAHSVSAQGHANANVAPSGCYSVSEHSAMWLQVLVEQSLLGWKEFELEVMRDMKDNVVIICSIENVDPMGVHTGDSITIAPAQTLTDKEYQRLRDAAVAIIREMGVETGLSLTTHPTNACILAF